MSEQIDSEKEYDAILERIRTKNTDHSAYLAWRTVKKLYYPTAHEIAEHFAEETKVHAKQIFDEKQIEHKNSAKEDDARLLGEKQNVEEFKKRVATGHNYFDFGETGRAKLEDLDRWLNDVPLSKWTLWHLETAQFLENIPHRTEVLSRTRAKVNEAHLLKKWEYLAITVQVKGASSGIWSSFMNRGLEDSAFSRLETLGNDGWEVVAASPLIHGAMAMVSTSALLVVLKRQKIS